MPRKIIIGIVAVALLAVLLYTQRAALNEWAFNLTGEEKLAGQARALLEIASNALRPPLDLRPDVPIRYNGVNPFAINTFLQQEVEVVKRETHLALLADAGFQWIRQEFPWYDIEVHGKGNSEDCRFPPCISAWDKYDNIVTLAEENDIRIIARLSSPPEWSRADGNARGPFAPPDRVSDFTDYAAAIAERYKGRVTFYQVWNEPNIFPEWGNQPADPEAYTQLLCATYQRLKAIDPSIVVLSGVLAPTSELGALNDAGGDNLNDYIYLQRMYDAGAKECFDILTVQGYGLWSGPGDHRMTPINVNFARNQFIRDIMVKNGDEHKAIWVAEMNWNAVPEDSGIYPNFGRVTLEQQARYAPLAYQRAQEDWPWVGAMAFWFFKRAGDSEVGEAWYYFRMFEPDLTPLPVYDAMKAYMAQTPTMYRGWFQEDHWAVKYAGWEISTDPLFTFGVATQSRKAGATATFQFKGTSLTLDTVTGPRSGELLVTIDGQTNTHQLYSAQPTKTRITLASGLADTVHQVEIISQTGENFIDGYIVQKSPDVSGVWLVAAIAVLVGSWWLLNRRGGHG